MERSPEEEMGRPMSEETGIKPEDSGQAIVSMPETQPLSQSAGATGEEPPRTTAEQQGGTTPHLAEGEATPQLPPEQENTLPLYDSLPQPYTQAAPFWHMPLELGVFYDTPLIVHQQFTDAERIVHQMESYLRNAGYEVEASELRMNYTQWVKTPAKQYEELRHELEPKRAEYLRKLEQVQKDIEKAQIDFTRAMAQAKIPFPEPIRSKQRAKEPPTPEPITRDLVERALKADFASDDEVCGEQGVVPPPPKGNAITQAGHWLFEIGAPLAAGLLLGINLGVIVGLLSLEVLQRAESLWLVALAAVVGLFVESLVGQTAYALASSAAQASERRDHLETATPFPYLHSIWRRFLFGMAILVLVAAVALVDALGLYTLYQERKQAAQMMGAETGADFMFWVFLIVGLIISAPYIVYKAVKGWREPEIRQREARVAYLHWKHIERRRAEPEVQNAFEQAEKVRFLYDECDRLMQALKEAEARLDSARAECVGGTQKFREYWDSLIAWLSKERAPYAPESARRNGQFRRSSARGETLLQKLTGLFRR
ncbi:MAG: hypothetical protein N2651_03770 [Fimbriimonadales bacterium]|nr:hypothetical protein [Fimbriimonadales bacterium]